MAGVEAWFSNSSWAVHSASACTAIGESMSCRSSCPLIPVSKPAACLSALSLCALSRLGFGVCSPCVGEAEIAVSEVWARASESSAIERSSSPALLTPDSLRMSRVSCSCAPLGASDATKQDWRRAWRPGQICAYESSERLRSNLYRVRLECP